MKIGDFREAVQFLDWSRKDLSASTDAEYLKTDVRARLEPHIEAVQALLPQVSASFKKDIDRAHRVIGDAQAEIRLWEKKKDNAGRASYPKAVVPSIATPIPRYPMIH